MTATYDPTLATATDWVRFRTGDTVVSPTTAARLSNEEIAAILTEEPNKWYAAAVCLESMYAQWVTLAKGVSEKKVDDLSIKRVESMSQLNDYIKHLRERGARELAAQPHIFRNIGAR